MSRADQHAATLACEIPSSNSERSAKARMPEASRRSSGNSETRARLRSPGDLVAVRQVERRWRAEARIPVAIQDLVGADTWRRDQTSRRHGRIACLRKLRCATCVARGLEPDERPARASQAIAEQGACST